MLPTVTRAATAAAIFDDFVLALVPTLCRCGPPPGPYSVSLKCVFDVDVDCWDVCTFCDTDLPLYVHIDVHLPARCASSMLYLLRMHYRTPANIAAEATSRL